MRRRQAGLALLGLLAGCGGGGGGASSSGGGPAPDSGMRDFRSLAAQGNGTTYGINLYLPPASAGPRSALPVLYALDGETWFDIMVAIVEAQGLAVIIAAINSGGLRNRDFVPANSCTTGGGGQAAFFDVMRGELLPFIEAQVGGDPRQRLLFGHSHGGSFVLYALFAQPPGTHAFKAYLSVDASIGCMPETVQGWEQAYAAAHAELPVRLHLSSASAGNAQANVAFGQVLEQRHYARLALRQQVYNGTHGGIVPQALSEGLAFGLASGG
ncbi:alpha/beta hydrolase [Aquabacterium sp.]|uniref:alpha/beta hydrolase n=1 Tax=Aquabacterium sp. TaxID=1872578 RepID=UPI00378372C6